MKRFMLLLGLLIIFISSIEVNADDACHCVIDNYGCYTQDENGNIDSYIMFWSEYGRAYIMGSETDAGKDLITVKPSEETRYLPLACAQPEDALEVSGSSSGGGQGRSPRGWIDAEIADEDTCNKWAAVYQKAKNQDINALSPYQDTNDCKSSISLCENCYYNPIAYKQNMFPHPDDGGTYGSNTNSLLKELEAICIGHGCQLHNPFWGNDVNGNYVRGLGEISEADCKYIYNWLMRIYPDYYSEYYPSKTINIGSGCVQNAIINISKIDGSYTSGRAYPYFNNCIYHRILDFKNAGSLIDDDNFFRNDVFMHCEPS